MTRHELSPIRRMVVALAIAASMMLALGVTNAPPASAATVTVTVQYNGNPCYVWGQKLSTWKAVITGSNGSTYYKTVNYGQRSTSLSVQGGASYNVVIQSWCNGIFAGRGASGNRWAYSSGYQPTWNFYAGVFY